MQQDDTGNRASILNSELIATRAPQGQGARQFKRQRRKSLLERIMDRLPLKKVRLGLFVILSIVFHLALMEGIYHLYGSRAQKKIKDKASPIVFKAQPIKENPPEQQPVLTASKSKPETSKADPGKKIERPSIRPLPARELMAIGKAHMEMVKEGIFPSLVLSYPNASSFVRQMYNLGAKTIIYDTIRRDYYDMDLFSNELIPMGAGDFKTFSEIKRVIRDSDFDDQKNHAAGRLNSLAEALQIVLLLPITMEERWIGHQVAVFGQMKVEVSDVDTVEARFQKGKIKLFRMHLKDGTTKSVNDPGCA